MKPRPGQWPRPLGASSKRELWRKALDGKWPSFTPKGLKSAPEREKNGGGQPRRILAYLPLGSTPHVTSGPISQFAVLVPQPRRFDGPHEFYRYRTVDQFADFELQYTEY